MTKSETIKAIRALPGMTAMHMSGEFRVTVNLYALRDRYKARSLSWLENKQEAIAYYTDDADDALATARDMSARWERGGA